MKTASRLRLCAAQEARGEVEAKLIEIQHRGGGQMKIIEVSSENRLCVDMNARNQVTLWSCIGPTNVHMHELTPEQAKWLAHELNVRAKKLEPKDER